MRPAAGRRAGAGECIIRQPIHTNISRECQSDEIYLDLLNDRGPLYQKIKAGTRND